jgi:tetratricopeptide (TPR) repeat protein
MFVCCLGKAYICSTQIENSMKNKGLLFLAFGLLTLLFSCRESREEQQLLDSIEQTWQQCDTSLPDANVRADRLRDSVRRSSEYVRQKLNLLNIRLRDKHHIIPSSPDSAIQTLGYFANKKNAVDKERAYYYMGSAYRDLKDYPRAVSSFLNAIDVAKQSRNTDTLIWQNSLSQLTFLYLIQLNYEEELNMALQSVELARQTGKYLGWYLMDVAAAYDNMNDTLHCIQYCDSSYQVICKKGFPVAYGGVLSQMLAKYAKYNHSEKVDTLLQHLLQLPEDQRPHNYELSLAMFHEKKNHIESAITHYRTYINKVKNVSGRYEASAGLQRCYMQKGDYRQAAEWGCRLYEINDSIIAQRAFEQTQRARDAYIYHRDQEEEQAIMQRDERIKFVSVITVLALISIVMGLVAYYYFRKKRFMEEIIGKDKMLKSRKEEILRRTKELDQKKQEIELLGCQLSDAEQTISASKVQLENTMRDLEQRTMINKELTRMALMNNATNKAEDVIEYFRNVAQGHATLKTDSWKELMAAIETLYPGFNETIQGRLKKQLREPLLYTICLLKIGLKPVQIARIMDAKIQTVWNRVKRAEETCDDLLRWQ